MHTVFLDTQTYGEAFFDSALEKWGTYQVYPTTLPSDTISRCQNADIIITNKVNINKEVIDSCPQLKLICVAATGTNNIDLQYAAEKKITVKNIKDYSTQSVAQITIGIILEQLNQIAFHDQYVKSFAYSKNDIFTYLGKPFYELSGKTFGIIGLGNIGRQVAKIATAFGANVQFHSLSGLVRKEDYPEVSLMELLSSSDIISIHAPLTDKSKRLIDFEKLKQMKPSAMIFNLGRGGIIIEEDLAKALNENIISGAGIDVFEQEPIPIDSPLLRIQDSQKITLSPHIGWASVEARKLALTKIYQHIDDFINKFE
ncbi:MAG: D-2-hydroxyacid dehydrogenase [Cytophagales bacterium]|nr:MAG: D-2-hydroxyacid dehydrogenase [Cytophagales bacterium]